MAPANPLALILQFLLQAAMFLFLARFILQVCRVDFYNPISQGIVRITDYALKPLRTVLPGYANLDFASFLAAWACLIIDIYARAAMSGTMIGDFMFVLAATLLSQFGVLSWVVSIFQGAIFIMIIASWIAPGSYHPALVLVQTGCGADPRPPPDACCRPWAAWTCHP